MEIAFEDVVLLLTLLVGFTQVAIPLFRGRPLFPIFRPRAYHGSVDLADERLRQARLKSEQAKKTLEAARLEAEAAKLTTEAHREMERGLAAQMEDFLPPPTNKAADAQAPSKKEHL